MTQDDLGSVAQEGDGAVVTFERFLRHPRARVWAAITESEHLAHWLPCDIVGERRAGAVVELPFWPAHVERYGLGSTLSLPGRITVWEPPAVFEWWWSTDRLRWELHEVDGGTRLRFTTWLGPDGAGTVRTAAGYHVCLGNLATLLDAGTAPPLVDIDPAPLERRYERLVNAGGQAAGGHDGAGAARTAAP